jgi:hypothetical protein
MARLLFYIVLIGVVGLCMTHCDIDPARGVKVHHAALLDT